MQKDILPLKVVPEAGLRPAVAAKLADLLARDDELLVSTTLAELVARHTKALFETSPGRGCEGLASRATDAVCVSLDDTLAHFRASDLPVPTSAGQKRLVAQMARLVDAFQARGAVVEERKRRDGFRTRIVAAIADLTEAVSLDPDIITLAATRLNSVLESATPLYPARDLENLRASAGQAFGMAAADALLKGDPAQAARRLIEPPFPALLGPESSARLADLARRLAPASAEDARHTQQEAAARDALCSAARALIAVLCASPLDAKARLAD